MPSAMMFEHAQRCEGRVSVCGAERVSVGCGDERVPCLRGRLLFVFRVRHVESVHGLNLRRLWCGVLALKAPAAALHANLFLSQAGSPHACRQRERVVFGHDWRPTLFKPLPSFSEHQVEP